MVSPLSPATRFGGMFSKVIWSLLCRLLLEGARIDGFVTARMRRLGSVVGGRLDGVSFVASYRGWHLPRRKLFSASGRAFDVYMESPPSTATCES